MKRKRSFSGNLTNQETVGGICYLVLQIFFLPGLLNWVNRQLSSPLRSPELNFLFFLINLLETYLLKQAVLSFLLIPFYPIFYLQMILPAAWGWVSLPVMPVIYLLILSLHRKKWHREWVVGSPK